MNTSLTVLPQNADLRLYAELKRRVRETLLEGQAEIERAKVRTYWDTGWYIKTHILLNEARAEYAEKVLVKLSEDLGPSVTVLRRCRQFAELFPDIFEDPIRAGRRESLPNPHQTSKNEFQNVLIWSHFRALFPLADDKKRYALAQKAADRDWSAERLETEARKIVLQAGKHSQFLASGQKDNPDLLTPKRGTLFTYQIVEDADRLALDHGFTSYWNLDAAEARGLEDGDLVEKKPGKTVRKISGPMKKSVLFTYEADPIRVVDGDTLWMKIYLEGRAAHPWLKEKLRLRGIDAPELNTPKGRRAKRFVEAEIAKARAVTITTTKPDKWDRYLSDVFLAQADGEEIFLNNLLLQNGLARVKTDYSVDDWDKVI